MKHRGLSLLLVVTFLLSVFLFCTTAFAASGEQDGLSAELITDKQEYTAGEEVGITLKVKNASPYVNNIWAKLVLPESLRLKQGELDSGVFELAVGGDEEFVYTADTPAPSTTTAAPTTTVAGTTVASTTGGSTGGPSDTGDVNLYIFGALAVFSLIGLVVVMGGFKGLFKNRWFVLVLCMALLLPVAAPLAASAVVSEKFFEVVTTVKVDGEDAEIKAVITYDFDDGVYPAAEVEFKAEGVSLYNLMGEMGWFTPCNSSIVVDGVAASNTSRPEVAASYIDMLFGCVNTKTNTFVPGILDNAQIISEDAEKQLLVGRTDDKASLKALDLISKDEWIITEIDGKIVVTGWYDNATVAAVQHLYDLVKDQDDVTLQLPIKGDMDGYIADIPNMDDAVFYGGMDSEEGAVILRYGVDDVATFEAYLEKLEEEGYEIYAENEIATYGDDKHQFVTFVKGEDVVHVSYLSDAFMEADYDSLTANEKAYYDRSFRPIGKEVRIAIDSTDALFTNEENNDYTDLGIQPKVSVVNLYNKVADGNNNAECLIYTLADGSFIVVDGGFTQDADQVFKALTELNERPDGKIVVAAWIMSHHHGDHVGAFNAMSDAAYAAEITVEQFIYNPTAQTYNWRSKNAPFNYTMDFNYAAYSNEAMAERLAKFGDGNAQIVNPHVGQKMYIRNAEVEFIFTGDEDLYPIHIDNTNDTSLVFSVTFRNDEGESDGTMMVLNDSCVDSQYGWIMPLFSQAMDCDIVQVAHHGLGGPSTALYRMMEPIVAIWCSTESTAIKNNWFVEKDGGGAKGGSGGYLLYRKADDTNEPVALRMLAEHHVQTLVLPYKAGDPVIKRNLGSYKSNFFELNKVKMATLDAGKFGGDLAGCLADIRAYLDAENADILSITDVTADQVDALVTALGYGYYAFTPVDADAANSEGNLLLSRYPITDFDTHVVETSSIGIALLDVEGIAVDVAFLGLESAGQIDSLQIPGQGDYQIIMGVVQRDMSAIANAAVANSTRENIYAHTDLGSGVSFTGGKLEDAGEKTGVDALNNLVSATVIMSRKHLIENFEEGEFDETPTVAVWWANYTTNLSEKEQVLTWLLKNKPEIIGLDHMPLELLSDEGAAEFAALAGYEYYAWVRKHTVSETTAYGQLLLSHYPIEEGSVSSVVLREIGAEGGEGRRYLRATVTMPGGEKVDVYVGDTDGNATNKAAQLATLEAAVKAQSEANNGRDFIILSCDAAIPTDFAGKTLKVYNGDGSYIAVSGNYPMDGMRTYGTKAYPYEGRSPIGTTIPNIDKYSKVELANLPKYELTVNGGTGSGEFIEEEEVYAMAGTPEKGMVFTGWVAEGVTLEDPMAMEQIFEMPAANVKLTATYKAVAYTERLETGSTSNEIKVAVLPTYRFQTKFTTFKDQIVQNIKDINADLIAITIVDYDSTCKYNSVNVVPELKEALADVYAHSYFAPATKVGTPSDTDPGAGYVGHLLLSKYPILSSETIELNSETSEVRAVGHSIINVGTESEPTRLGVYYSHLGAGSNWTSGKQNLYDVVANADEDAFVMIGKLHYTDNKTTINQKLGTTVAAKDANLTVFGSGNITVKADSYGEDSTLRDAYTAAGFNAIEKLYYATVSMPLYEDGDTKYPVNITADGQTTVNGWYAENATVTVTAPAAPAGYKFNSWTLPAGLDLTEGDATTATIQFTMPAATVDLSMAYAENPTGTVAFNVNGGFGTLENVTANVGDYTLPTAIDVLSPAGKKFAGWGLTATATKAEAVNTAVVTKDATTTVYAIWEDTGSVSLMQWWINNPTTSDIDKVKAEVREQNADIVGLVSMTTTSCAGLDIEAFVESIGYPYYKYVKVVDTNNRGNILLSKYPFTYKQDHADASNYKQNHFEVTVGAEKLNVYTGYDCVPANFEAAVRNDVAANGADFVLLTHRAGRLVGTSTFAGLPITAGKDSENGIAVSLNKWAVTTAPTLTATGRTFSSDGMETDVMLASIHLKAYTVSFDAGEGSGNQAPIYTDGGNTALPTTTTFTAPAGSVFAGWSETADGEVISGNSINITGDKTLYAVWKSTFTATVTDGTGSGTYTVGDTVTLTANAAPEGKVFSYWEGLGGLTLTEGNAVSSTLKFTMPGKNVAVQAVYREIGTMKIASVWANKFANGQYKGDNIAKINAELLDANADVMAIIAIDENAMKADDSASVWNGKTLTAMLNLLKHEYPYQYFAKAWYVYHDPATADANKNDGWYGHLILSKFPFNETETTITQVAGNVTTEGRACAAVTVNVDGVLVDIFAMANGANNNNAQMWNVAADGGKTVADTINGSNSDAWIAMGNLHYDSAAKIGTINAVLENGSAGVDIDNSASTYTDKIVGSTNLTYVASSKYNMSDEEKNNLVGTGRTAQIFWQSATVILPEKLATVSFNANGGTGNQTAATVREGMDYTLPATTFTAPTGHQFKGWATSANGTVITSPLNVTGNVELFAIWEPISLKVGYFSSYRFSGKYDTPATATEINNKIMNSGLDVLVINQIERGNFTYPSSWNDTSDPVNSIIEAVKDVYPYYYYASAGLVCDGSTGEIGNLLLSKYPIDTANSETISLETRDPYTQSGSSWASSAEGRPAGRARLNVAGYTVDVYYTHTGTTDQGKTLAGKIAEMAASENAADAWIATGFMSGIDANAALTGYTMKNTGNCRVMGSNVLTFSALTTDSTTFTGYNSSSSMYYATVTLPEA